jgi:hypothetical protein
MQYTLSASIAFTELQNEVAKLTTKINTLESELKELKSTTDRLEVQSYGDSDDY